MANMLASTARKLAAVCGYELVEKYRPILKRPIAAGAKLYVGCGEHQLDGYVGCDLRDLEHIDLICKAWEVSEHCSQLSEIYSRHMLEHLTLAEAKLTLGDWRDALQDGGKVRIEVPNMDFHVSQWSRAQWDANGFERSFSDTSWGFAGFYGWQRECDPQMPDYNSTYWDCHKSGYTAKSMQYFLAEAGFGQIEIRLEGFSEEQAKALDVPFESAQGCHLVAVARKLAASSTRPSDVRAA